ncbi:DNA-directed DNA polymerase alpha subunit pol12 [Entomortierella chlamydospora]|uniref:DNA polymerase alpha subunit B n=1 Tax=Entomortierella chlamydospora TaxID=101097 RepID=A0A9P6MUT2_9FUNG|nr:DNA-directed DNA polymerase alpha subunit pol12 [Entomortierella chlamydospora]
MSAQEQKERALLRAFGPTLAGNPTALRECVSLLLIYRIEPEALHTKWEAYIMNQTNATGDEEDGSMTSERLEGFKSNLRRTLEQQSHQQSNQYQGHSTASSSFATTKRAAIRPRQNGPVSKFSSGVGSSHMDESFIDSGSNSTMPTSAIRNSVSKPSTSSIQFAQRKNISEIDETLNSNLGLRTEPPHSSTEHRNDISLVAGVKPYRYMFEKITEKAEALDDRIDWFADLYRKAYPDTVFHNPAYPSQSIVTVIGRICSDANEGKSNERSLVLETSRSIGGGSRVKLDVSELTGFSFFPGQIVVLSGINANRSIFAVTQVHKLPPLPMARANPEELVNCHYKKLGGQPIKMIVAAGPYTLSDNLLFEPFSALMNHVSVERPDILLLKTYRLSNPAQFTINEMVFAVNTADILMNLCGEEIARNPARTDRMGHVSRYLIDQRNMHPVYPGLTSDIEGGIDFNQYDLMELRVCPDVVILPSKLKSFAKISDNVVMINPNQLCKAHSGGTFARLTIHPIPQSSLDAADMSMGDEDDENMLIFHEVYQRCRVDIVRV